MSSVKFSFYDPAPEPQSSPAKSVSDPVKRVGSPDTTVATSFSDTLSGSGSDLGLSRSDSGDATAKEDRDEQGIVAAEEANTDVEAPVNSDDNGEETAAAEQRDDVDEKVEALLARSGASDTTPTAVAAEVSTKLKSMMQDRISAIENIRFLLEAERNHDEGVVVKKVAKLERSNSSKKEKISALADELSKLKAKNGDYVQQLSNLVNDLNDVSDQNAELKAQLEAFEAENRKLKNTVDVLETKNSDLACELEDLLTSLKELVEQNGALEVEMKQLSITNKRQEEAIFSLEKKSCEVLDTVEALTSSLEEAKVSRDRAVEKSSRLQSAIDEVKSSAADAAESTASTIGLLEKDIEEEFQIATSLKRGMEDLKKRLASDGDEDAADEMEALLASLRKIQVWQLSHFERINKMTTENKEQARKVQLLG